MRNGTVSLLHLRVRSNSAVRSARWRKKRRAGTARPLTRLYIHAAEILFNPRGRQTSPRMLSYPAGARADGHLIKRFSALQNGLLLSSHRRSFASVTVEQGFCDGTRRAGSDFPIVDLNDRHDLARR